ncbi:MAG: DUF4192 domain-containing protein [Actinobacteria bacterium]|nr:DUF4192 domain-containing protein [Actinomycetota bacterium]
MTSQDLIHVDGPAGLLEMVPYLVGFHPRDSLVLVGLRAGRVAVTVRMDLADAAGDADTSVGGPLDSCMSVLGRAGADAVVAVVYAEPGTTVTDADVAEAEPVSLPFEQEIQRWAVLLTDAGFSVLDVLGVLDERWWSYPGRHQACACCAGARQLDRAGAVAASATYAGLVALPDRGALAELIDADPDAQRRLAPLVQRQAQAWTTRSPAILDKHRRSVIRALFATARDMDAALIGPIGPRTSDERVALLLVGLTDISVRDSVWFAIEEGRIEGRELWRMLAVRAPDQFAVAPLFLLAWICWREGNGALAMIAAERALRIDPDYAAADLLRGAVAHGLDPFRTPRLRRRRSAA